MLPGGHVALTDPAAPPTSFEAHIELFGPLPAPRAALASASGIFGRGGAGFPLDRKLRTVQEARGRAVVIANGAESEPGALKDVTLMTHAPHLVLDGLELAGATLGTTDLFVVVEEPDAQRCLATAAAERGLEVEIVVVTPHYLVGQETAAISALEGRRAVPRFQRRRVTERGYRGRPTLVSNVETLAQWALCHRFGSTWHANLGTRGSERSSRLVSLHVPGTATVVAEIAPGTTLRELLDVVGAPRGLVLVGGCFGSLGATFDPAFLDRHLVGRATEPDELALGAGNIVVAPGADCTVCAATEVVAYLASKRAQQCGPCTNGVPELAQALRRGDASSSLLELAGLLERRGACALPDAAAQLARSVASCETALARHRERGCHSTPFGLSDLEVHHGSRKTDRH